MSRESEDQDDRLGRLVEEALAALERGEEPDATILAARHLIDRDEVLRCLEGLRALAALGGEWLGEEGKTSALPSLPADFQIRGEIGRGGMGIVYRAHQISLDREVAVKVLRPGELHFARSIARFRKEAQALARLRHPNIVTIHEVGEVDGQVYFTMDLVEGRSLHELIASGELQPRRAVTLLRQVAAAIDHSHRHGIIHRDLKPLNILIDENDRPFVSDFGLARQIEDSAELTRTGQVIGTPHYMSPEQARGDTDLVGEATDIWALGAILHECLCGQPPFPGTSPVQVLHDVIHRDPKRPGRIRRGCPPALEALVGKALEKQPADRYPTARALLEDLERFEQGRSLLAERRSGTRSLQRFLRRNAAVLSSALAATAFLGLVFALTIFPRLGRDPETARAIGDELWRSGDRAGAAMAYAWATEDEPTFNRIVAGRLDHARQLRAEGRAEVAITMLENLLREGRRRREIAIADSHGLPSEHPWKGALDVQLERSFAIVESRGLKAADATWEALRQACGEEAGRPQSPWGADALILDRLLPFLDHAEGPLRDWARSRTQRYFRSVQATLPPSLDRHRTAIIATIVDDPQFDPRYIHLRLSMVLQRADADLVARLMSQVEDPTRTRRARSAAALVLCDVLDLPLSEAERERGEWEIEDLEAVAALAGRISGASALAGYQLRVERALELMAEGARELDLWFYTRTTEEAGGTDIEALRGWWQEHRDESPEGRWAQALGGQVSDSESRIADRFAGQNYGRMFMAHAWLCFRRMPERSWLVSLGQSGPREEAWRLLVSREEVAGLQLRVDAALFPIDGGIIDEFAADAASLPIDVDGSVSPWSPWSGGSPGRLSLAWAQDIGGYPVMNISPPGLGFARALPASTKTAFSASPRLQSNRNELRINLDSMSLSRSGPGWSSSLGGSGPYLRLGAVVVAAPSRFPADLDREAFVVLVHGGDDRDGDSPRTLADWRRLAADSLSALAARPAPETDLALSLRMWSADSEFDAAFILGLPEAVADMRTIDASLTGTRKDYSDLRRKLRRARLMAGDLELIAELEEQDETSDELFDGKSDDADRARLWVHVACNSPAPAARELAWQRLEAMRLEPAQLRTLADARRRGLALPEALIRKVDDSTRKASPFIDMVREFPLVGTILLVTWTTGLLGLLLLVRPRLRRLGGAFLILSGLLMASTDVALSSTTPALPTLGWFLAALGSFLIGRTLNGAGRFLAATYLSGAMILDGLLRFVVHRGATLESMETGVLLIFFGLMLCQYAAVFGLVLLTRLFAGSELEDQGRSYFGAIPVGSLVMGLLLALLVATTSRFMDIAPSEAQGMSATIVWITLIITLLRTAKRRLDYPASVPGWAWLTSYFLPVLLAGSLILVSAAARSRGSEQVLNRDFAFFVTTSVLIAIPILVLRLIYLAGTSVHRRVERRGLGV